MKKNDVISHFGTVTKAAEALGLTKSAISQWPDEIPKLRAFEIERLTDGKLNAEFSHYQQVPSN
ncbi:Cro/CI family transcriptional regulator [Psychromonas aquimarina]|uniref:Cro/CI family transcriptional regulator n=1 Tax=Psychromonas aquimarina TaxID=444919 RepID=UPI000420BB62|nr:Cro/CI family transcriptional regulator [Psychromonas aquimarina]